MNLLKNKPLQNQALIYDKDCPMCCVYTNAFIKAGVLEQNGRQPYSEQAIDSTEWDAERAKNEIALVNYKDGTVKYGIDSMFTVISHRFTFLKPLFSWKPFHWLMKKFYSFISYNRKVIAPPAKNPGENACVPDVNLKYRWMYIVLAALIAAGVNALALGTLKEGIAAPAFGIITGIILLRFAVQSIIVQRSKQKDQLLNYLGNLATVNLQLGILVALAFLAKFVPSWAQEGVPFYLFIIFIYTNVIHTHRLKSLGMSSMLCLAWTVQWVFIYAITLGILCI